MKNPILNLGGLNMAYDMEPGKWYELPENDGQYPYDGQAVWLTEDMVSTHAGYWRKTRTYDGANMKWVEEAFWARRNAGGQRLEINPVGFMKLED